MKQYTQAEINAIVEFNNYKVSSKFISLMITIYGLDIFDIVELSLEAYDLI